MSQPYKCPICEGTGKVPAGFYSMGVVVSDSKSETCRSCQGTGIAIQMKEIEMDEKEMEKVIEEIWQFRLDEILSGEPRDKTLKLAILDGYKAGMEAARKVFTS